MILRGKDIVILNSSKTALIAASKSCDIEVQVDTEEVSSPSSGTWKVYKTKRKGWSVSLSHLLLSSQFTSNMMLTGTEVTILLSLNPDSLGLKFDGMVNNPTIASTGYSGTPAFIYWDTTRKKFLGKTSALSTTYYQTWSVDPGYLSPQVGAMFTYNNDIYVYSGTDIAKDGRVQGTAIFQQCKVNASNGKLASGAFKLLGSGELMVSS